MDALQMKLTEAGHPVLESLYLNFFVNSLPEEFDVITNTIDFNKDMVDKVVSNLRQIEMKKVQVYCSNLLNLITLFTFPYHLHHYFPGELAVVLHLISTFSFIANVCA